MIKQMRLYSLNEHNDDYGLRHRLFLYLGKIYGTRRICEKLKLKKEKKDGNIYYIIWLRVYQVWEAVAKFSRHYSFEAWIASIKRNLLIERVRNLLAFMPLIPLEKVAPILAQLQNAECTRKVILHAWNHH